MLSPGCNAIVIGFAAEFANQAVTGISAVIDGFVIEIPQRFKLGYSKTFGFLVGQL